MCLFGVWMMCPWILGVKLPKNSNFGGVNRTFKPERQKFQTLITWKLSDHDEILTGSTHHECALVGGPMASPNKSKIAAAAIFNFGKMSITPHWINISAPNFTGRCITAMRRCQNRKLIRVTSSNEQLKHKCVDLSNHCIYFNPIWYRTQIPHCQHTRIAKFT